MLLVCFIRVFLFRLRVGVDQKEASVVGKITRHGVIQHFKRAVCAHSVLKRLSGLGKLRRELIHFKLHSGICVAVYIFIAVFGADDVVRHLHLFARCHLAVFKILAKALNIIVIARRVFVGTLRGLALARRGRCLQRCDRRA